MSENYRLGINAKIYQGAAGAALAIMTEMSNVKDVTVNLSTGSSDVTTRANSGFKASAPTLTEHSLEFKMQYIPSDAGFQAIQTAFFAKTAIALAALTGEKATSGSEGPRGDYVITKFTRSEPLNEAISYDVTAELSAWAEWVSI